jgi:hypothetical protein
MARSAVAPDLDAVVAEVDQLRKQVVVMRTLVGLPPERPDRIQRRAQVVRLRADGLSVRSIATPLGVRRETISKDLRALGAPPARVSVGIDGAVRHHTPPSA